MNRRRDGFTLIEMLVVLVLLLPLWAGAMGLAVAATQAAVRAAGQAAAEEAVATSVAILDAELGDLAAGELLLVEPIRLRLHAARGAGRWCRADSAGVVVSDTDWAASRTPVAGRDSLWLEWVSDDSAGGRRPIRLGLVSAPAPEQCAAGIPGLRLPAALIAALPTATELGPLVRTTEVIELAAYTSGGETWLGIRHLGTGEAIQPAAGPFVANGVRFEGLDAVGTTTSDPGAVRAVRVRLRTAGPILIEREVIIALRG